MQVDGRWIGNGISYGPHRDGQWPGGPAPSDAQIREDLALLLPRWSLWRIYSADATAEAVLRLLRSERAGAKIILGAWIAPETSDAVRAANRAEVSTAIRLANAYPELVLGINVGNETQVTWSDHRVPAAVLIGYLREARAGTRVPVTTADDFSFWVTPESDAVAAEVDFLMVHAYAMWNGKQLADAVAFTREKYAEVGKRHPGRTRILGELGWATRKSDEGEQGRLIRGEPGEAQQKAFREELLVWTTREEVANLFFEAFDENWKGGPQPDEVEKHWGLFRADRTPKKAMQAAP
jgi:exo-beta-1,3-glucanase (GH17 family)